MNYATFSWLFYTRDGIIHQLATDCHVMQPVQYYKILPPSGLSETRLLRLAKAGAVSEPEARRLEKE